MLPILLGVFSSHLIFTLYILVSNHQLYEKLISMMDAGYLVVPNAHILPSLLSIKPSFIGATFFTLTIGIALSFLSFFLARLWMGPFKRSKQYIQGLLFVLIVCLFFMNRNGINILFSTWLIGVFGLVFKLTTTQQISDDKHLTPNVLKLHLPLLIVLSVMWVFPTDGNIFISIRDRILFPSDVGGKIIDLYYRYTLYPAEAIKSFEQKLFVTCRLEGFQNKKHYQTLVDSLPAINYLPLPDENTPVDVVISENDNSLFFLVKDRIVYKKNTNTFLSQTKKVLTELSQISDRHRFMRRLIALSLLIGLPLIGYGLFFKLTRLLLSRFLSGGKLSFGTMVICVGMVLVGYVIAIVTAPKPVSIKQLPEVLSSKDWNIRRTGLETIVSQQLEIMSYADPDEFAKSPYPLERMWAARSFGNSRSPKTFELLWTLIDDDHPNVACMALRSIGKRGNESAVLPVIHWIKNSNHWYAQWYAYQTLKMLRWKQEL